jgi:hypothetical protein
LPKNRYISAMYRVNQAPALLTSSLLLAGLLLRRQGA